MRGLGVVAILCAAAVAASACSAAGERSAAREMRSRSEPATPSPTASDEGTGGGIDSAERPQPRPLPPSEWVIGPRGDGAVFLALDGRPRAGALEGALGALEDAGASAAFFLPGRWIGAHRERAAAVSGAGHVLGNRGWDGKRLTARTARAMERALRRAEAEIAAAGTDPHPFFAPPRARRGRKLLRVAGRLGYRGVRFGVAPAGGRHRDVTRRVVDAARPGAIVALDLGRRSHLRALPRVLRRIERDGYRVAPWSEMRRARPVRWDRTLAYGAEGKVVRRLQRALNRATYPAGAVDGKFGPATQHGLRAFARVEGLDLGESLEPREIAAVVAARPPDPPRPGRRYVDIDITRQVLIEVRGGRVVNTYPISTGSGETYYSEGELRIARTPRGRFSVTRKIAGWRVSHLGQLYYPLYFYGGYAIHGSPSVPDYPASHGCVRIPMHVAVGFFERTGTGVSVFVHD